MFITLDLGGTALKYGFGTPEEGLLHEGKTPLNGKSRQAIYDLLVDTALMLRDKLPQGAALEAAALGTAGIVNSDSGVVMSHCPNLPQWQGAEPGRVLSERLGVPVYVDNDANLMTYGEASLYGFRGVVLGVTLGTGIGGGLVVGSDIYTGAGWSAMEIGHVIAEPNGRLCGCGRRGCIEAYASATAMVDLAADAWRSCHRNSVNEIDRPTVKQILDNMVDNKSVHDVILRQLDRLGIVLANAVTILAPDVLIVGGGVSEIDSFPWDTLEDAVRNHLLPSHNDILRIERARLGNRAALVGGLWRCRCKRTSRAD